MTVKELAVLYALNSNACSRGPDEPVDLLRDYPTHVGAAELTRYIRQGFQHFGGHPGLTGPLKELDPKWKPSKRQVVNILTALRGRGRGSFFRRRLKRPLVETVEANNRNYYCLSQAGVEALCV